MESEEKQKIKRYFDEFIFGFIFNDIQPAICGKANFLAALGLLCYTEFMGGLMRGEFKKSENILTSRQQRLSRKVKGSNCWQKVRLLVAKIQEKISN